MASSIPPTTTQQLTALFRKQLATFDAAEFAREWWSVMTPEYQARPAGVQVRAILLAALAPFTLDEQRTLLLGMLHARGAVAAELARRRHN